MIRDMKHAAQLKFGVSALLGYVERLDGVLHESTVRTQDTDLEVSFLGSPATTIKFVTGSNSVPRHPLRPHLPRTVQHRHCNSIAKQRVKTSLDRSLYLVYLQR